MKYFKFRSPSNEWILPVWEESVMDRNPHECFMWDKSIKFVGEVTKQEYDRQFERKKRIEPVQQEFDFS